MEYELRNDQENDRQQIRRPLVNATEMSRILGCSERWVTDAARGGRIPAIPVGRLWRFDPDEVIEQLRVPAKLTVQAPGAAVHNDAMVTCDKPIRRTVEAVRRAS